MPILMAALYLMPAILLADVRRREFRLDVDLDPAAARPDPAPDRGALRWSLPARGSGRSITWAVIVAITWPIVFLREADFAPWILPLERVSNTSIGIEPWQVGLNVTYFAIGHNLGILFVDALCRWYRARSPIVSGAKCSVVWWRRPRLRRVVADLPGLCRSRDSSIAGSGPTCFAPSGTLGDPNKLGAVAGVLDGWRDRARAPAAATVAWMLTVVAHRRSASRPYGCPDRAPAWRRSLSACRSPLFEAIRAHGGSTVAIDSQRVAWRRRRVAGDRSRLIVLQNASTHTIVQRGTLGYLPFYRRSRHRQERQRTVVGALWLRARSDPDDQGASDRRRRRRDVPLARRTTSARCAAITIPPPTTRRTGSGTSSRSSALSAACRCCGGASCLAMLLFSSDRRGDRLSFGMLRGVLIGFGVASMFGMPAQSVAIVLTFWVFVFWLVARAGDVTSRRSPRRRVDAPDGDRRRRRDCRSCRRDDGRCVRRSASARPRRAIRTGFIVTACQPTTSSPIRAAIRSAAAGR